MNVQNARSNSFVFLTVFTFLLIASFATAQETGLSDTIRTALMGDPRTSELSEAEIDAMVSALTEEAEMQGVTPEDILWRPQEPQEVAEQGQCGGLPELLCALNEAFGFDGSALVIPIALGIASALLLFLIGMLLYRLGHHPIVGNLRREG